MNKKVRQKALLDLIKAKKIGRQEDIVAHFISLGEQITQATVSRDINELGLVKVPNSKGGFHYHLPQKNDRPHLQRLKRALQQSFLSVRAQKQMLLMKVQPGNGPLVSKLLEQVQLPEIFGTISDDDSVLVLLKDGYTAQQAVSMIQKMLEK